MSPSSRSLLKSALVYGLTNALAAGVPFLLLPLLTRTLSPEEYGVASIFLIFVQLLGALTGLSVHGAISVRYFQTDGLEFETFVKTCLWIVVVSSLVIFGLVFLSSGILASLFQIPAAWLLIAVLVSSGRIVILIRLAILQASGRPWEFGRLRVFQAVLDVLLSVALIVGIHMSWEGRASGLAVAVLITAVLSLRGLASEGCLSGKVSEPYVRNALAFGIPLIPHALGAMLIASADRILVGNLIGMSSTGLYMVAAQIGMALGLCTDAFNKAFAPWLFGILKSDEGNVINSPAKIRVVRLTYAYFAIVTIIAAAIGLSSDFILPMVAGPAFSVPGALLVFIALGYAFNGMYLMVTNYVFFAGRTGSLAKITLLSAMLNIGLSYFMLTRVGLVGAAVSFMLTQATLFLLTWRLAKSSVPMPWLSAIRIQKEA